jgi:predicted ATP-grasp superfamily ATP-dependent carboligase
LPRSSSAELGSLLVAAVSGRALAASARRAGYTPLVADFFADADTREIAQRYTKFKGDIGRGIAGEALDEALGRLAQQAPSPILGLVYGSGFEDRPMLLRRIAERWPVIGNDAATIERIKAPEDFFAELDRLEIPHPRTVMEPPAATKGWLVKRRGGAGGGHIARHGRHAKADGVYFQEAVSGRAVSALFVADGVRALVLGFSEQWTAPTGSRRFRYGGAVRPAEIADDFKEQMISAVEIVAANFALKGLGSADFMVGDREIYLIEINPRPGATLDIFDSDSSPLLRIHIEGVTKGVLPSAKLGLSGAAASAVVFAPQLLRVPATISWPDWTADRPACGESIDKSRPICTVSARAETAPAARRLLEERVATILAACAA